MPTQPLILAALALVVLVQLLALWLLLRSNRGLRRRFNELASLLEKTVKATDQRMDRWERSLLQQCLAAQRKTDAPSPRPAVPAGPPRPPSPPRSSQPRYKDAGMLVRDYNELVRDRDREQRFRRNWNPTTMDIDSSLAKREADDGTFWLIPLNGAGQGQFVVPTRRLVSTDLTVLTAMGGDGARQLLGHLYEIETGGGGTQDQALLLQAARLQQNGSGCTLIQRGRLRLP